MHALGDELAEVPFTLMRQRLIVAFRLDTTWRAWRVTIAATVAEIRIAAHAAAESTGSHTPATITEPLTTGRRRRVTSDAFAAPQHRSDGVAVEAQDQLAARAHALAAALRAVAGTLAEQPSPLRKRLVRDLRTWQRQWDRAVSTSVLGVIGETCVAAKTKNWTFRDISTATGISCSTVYRRAAEAARPVRGQTAAPPAEISAWVGDLVAATHDTPDDPTTPEDGNNVVSVPQRRPSAADQPGTPARPDTPAARRGLTTPTFPPQSHTPAKPTQYFPAPDTRTDWTDRTARAAGGSSPTTARLPADTTGHPRRDPFRIEFSSALTPSTMDAPGQSLVDAGREPVAGPASDFPTSPRAAATPDVPPPPDPTAPAPADDLTAEMAHRWAESGPAFFDEDRYQKILGDELRKLRRQRGWTRKHLREQLRFDISLQTLSTYEHGTRRMSVLRLIELSLALGERPQDLIARVHQRATRDPLTVDLTVDLSALAALPEPHLAPLRSW
ncbi:helix-turn-helix domain-containing protein, partial [Amycolatopsis lexingtonensis]|uniref:helix-turn-helix domain-containing protein n=1 Tax=Amycolatopsis lexingtonensis TaxID=218822 RepID=UPI0020130152